MKIKKIISKVFAGLIIVLLVLGGNVNVAQAATFTFNQTDWSGGATANTAVHPTDQNNWTQYTSTTTGLTTANSSADLQLNSISTSVTKTTDADFSGGTPSNTQIQNNSIKLNYANATGDYDLLIGRYEYGATYAYENTGSASSPAWTAKPSWNGPISSTFVPALADLDNDGDYDLLLGYTTGGTYAYENTGSAASPTWTAKLSWNAPDVGDSSSPALADLDNDGDHDLLIGTYGSNVYSNISYAYENTGSASSPVWTAKPSWNGPGTASGFFANPALADLDNDGDHDLLIGGDYYRITYAYENTGSITSPVWTAKPSWNVPDVGLSRARPALADLDNDGDHDLLLGAYYGFIYAYENTGSITSPVWTAKPSWNGPDVADYEVYPALADLDNDRPYFSSGTYGSASINLGQKSSFSTLNFTKTTNASTTLTVDIRAGNTASPDGTWTAWQTDVLNGGSISGLNGNQYVQYRANLSTTDANYTPSLDDITINYSYYGVNYQNLVLNESSLVSYWKMDNNWNDSEGTNHGTATGATFGTPKYGTYSGSFDGTNDYVSVTNNVSLNPTTITVEAWVKLGDYEQDAPIVFKSDPGGWSGGYGLFYIGSVEGGIAHTMRFNMGNSMWGSRDAYISFPSDGAWHYVVGKYDGTAMRIFLDGVEGTPSYYSAWSPSSQDLFIGAASASQYPFNGLIDEVAIYNTALSASTIASHYDTFSSSLTSSAYNTTDSANLIGGISWAEDVSLPSGTGVTVSLRTASTSAGLTGSWSDFTNATTGCSKAGATVTCSSSAIPTSLKDGSNDQWFQYKALLTSDGYNTPTFSSTTAVYVVNASPQFNSSFGTNGVSISQISDSGDPNWGKVNIQYSVRDIDATSGTNRPGNDVIPSFEYNIGSGWTAITSQYLAAGDLNAKIVEEGNYTTYTAVWDAKSQIPGNYTTGAQIRVTIDDGESAGNTAQAQGANFILDTKNPTISVSSFTIDSSNDTVSYIFSNTDDSSYSKEYRISNNSDLSDDTLNASSTQWNAMPASVVTATTSWNFTGSPSFESVYLGVHGTDVYGNTASTTASSTAPSAPQNLSIFDISNAATSDYKEFLNWRLYTATTTAQFQKYEIYRSLNGVDYSLLANVTDINQNYYTDSTVASTTTYYYKMRILDANNDISSYSSIVSDQPDGQGGSDYIPPTITDVLAAEIQATWARITWTTDELSNSRVEFSTQAAGDYTSSTTVISYVTSHEVTIPDLTPNTSYIFRVKSKDVLNNEGSGAGTAFTTLGGPIISDATTESVNDRGAVIFWNTNEDSNSYVVYSTSLTDLRNNVNTSEIGTPGMVAGPPYQHRVTLSSLNPRTTYYYYVKSTDIDNNTVTDKNDGNYYSFVTTYDTKVPTISNISTPVKTSSAIVIIWQTDELADSQVQYGRTSGIYTDTTTLDSTYSINHAVSLSSLLESTTYYYQVKSADANGNQATSAEQTATTTSAREIVIQQVGGGGGIAADKDTSAPIISNINVSDITAFGANVSFSTNELTTGFSLYGKNEKYGNTAGSSNFLVSHNMNLSGLKLGTTYHFKVIAVDKYGNTSISEDKTFTTKFAAEALEELMTLENAEQFQEELEGMIESVMPSLVPPFVGSVEVSEITEVSATVSWRSNVPAYATAAYAGEKDFDVTKANPYLVELSQMQKKSKEHKMELANLSPSTVYHLQARSFVFPGVVGKSKDITFTTRASKIKPEISKLGNIEAEIRWVTEMETSSFAEYTDLRTKKIYRVGDSARVRGHALKLENLTSDTSYDVRVFGYDENNNFVEGDPLRIRTKKDIVAPAISGIKIDNALLPGRTDKLQSVVSWKTDEPANSLVYFEEGVGVAEELVNKTGQENEYTTDHIIILTNLKPATIYRIRVASSDESDNLGESAIRTILTPRSPESVFDVIIRNFQDTFGFLKKLQ